MKNLVRVLSASAVVILTVFCSTENVNAQCADLYIAGIFDGPLGGGTPKGVQLCATAAIPDLSIYGIGSANNGGGTDGEEFTFPAVPLASGSCIWVASESTNFTAYFGFAPDYTDAAANNNGDDALELFCNGAVVDVFGDINVDGNGECWEYLDGWAQRNAPGQNGGVFDCANWTFSGPNAVDGCSDNASCTSSFPLGGTPGCTDPAACNFDAAATVDNGTCFSVGDTCDDGDATTSNDVYTDCSTCAGTPTGLNPCTDPVWEVVDVTLNSQSDTWTVAGGTASVNGFTGSAGDPTDVWLVYGPLDMSATSTLDLVLDIAEGFNGGVDSQLDFQFTESYSGCPSDAANAWTSVGTALTAGDDDATAATYSFGAGTGTDVYIAIQYTSDGAGGSASQIDLSNISLQADTCPAVGTPIVSGCAPPACSITGASVTGSCVGTDYVYDVAFTVVGGSGNYDVIDLATGFVLASGTGSPVQGTIVGSTGGAGFDIEVRDAADATCFSETITLAPLDCSMPAVCPGAFISEFAYDCDTGDANEVIEVCIPNTYTGALADLQVDLYNGNGGVVYNTITLDQFTAGVNDGTNTYYSWPGSGSSLQNGAPDGLGLSFQGVSCEFLSYEGPLTATAGPANGLTSTDVGVSQNNGTTCDETIQFFGGAWVNACATVGDVNSDAACMAVMGCTDANACNYDPAATMDDGSCFSVGDTCDDGDPNTMNDVYTDCMTCAGTAAMCAITIDSEVVSACNNGGTPNDPADDTYTVTVTATVTNGSGSYTISDGTTTSPVAASGTAVVMGPYPADGTTTVSFTAADSADATCSAASAAALGPVNSCDLPANCAPNVGTYPWNGQ